MSFKSYIHFLSHWWYVKFSVISCEMIFFWCSEIDNTPIQCLHGKVPVSKISSMKRLSAKAWNRISSKVPYHMILNTCRLSLVCEIMT